MILALFELLAAVPLLTLLLVTLTTWLVRRRPGRVRHAWLVGIIALLVAADEVEELPLPEPTPGGAGGQALSERHTVEFGVGGGQFQTCAGVRQYGDLGATYRYTTPISAQTNLTVSGGGYAAFSGIANEPGVTPSGAVRGSVGLEHRWAGGSVGVIAGAPMREDTITGTPVLPTATLRIGPRDMFFVDANLFDVSPAPLPGPLLELGVGIAFPRYGNQWEPLRLRGGVSGMGVFLSPTLPVGEIGNLDITGAYGDPNTWGVSARMRLHFAGQP
ncbi:MAG: hypothetical protein Q8P41_13920 [Pseudomonadota bacterium]|nr:hypothetical protein [Pseudomonadota bacterium]